MLRIQEVSSLLEDYTSKTGTQTHLYLKLSTKIPTTHPESIIHLTERMAFRLLRGVET